MVFDQYLVEEIKCTPVVLGCIEPRVKRSSCVVVDSIPSFVVTINGSPAWAAVDIKISKTQTAALMVRLRSGARVNMVSARRSNAARLGCDRSALARLPLR